MLTIQEAFGAYLLAQLPAAIANAFPFPSPINITDEDGGVAIYPKRGLQDSAADPYFIWGFTHYSEQQDVGGPPEIADAQVRIECNSKESYDLAQQLAQIVQIMFRRQLSDSNPRISGGPLVLQTWLIDSPDEDSPETGEFMVAVHIGMQMQLDLVG